MQTDTLATKLDNRRRRTEDRLLAVSFQLDQVLEEHDLEVCLLTDGAGAVLASAQNSAQELARVISIIRTPGQKGEDIVQRSFFLQGMRMCLTLAGPDVAVSQAAFERIVAGITRIQATTICKGLRADLQVLADEGVLTSQ